MRRDRMQQSRFELKYLIDEGVASRVRDFVRCYLDMDEFVILELKFTNRFPNWFRDLVRMANTLQTGAAKYVSGVTGLGHRKLAAHAAVLEEESLLSSCRPGDDLPDFVRQDTGVPRQVSGR